MTKKKSTEETSAEVKQRYVDILTNGGFKAFFGDKKNKKAVIDILNVLLPAHRQVEDIDYLSTEQYGQTEENREFLYECFFKRHSSRVGALQDHCLVGAFRQG